MFRSTRNNRAVVGVVVVVVAVIAYLLWDGETDPVEIARGSHGPLYDTAIDALGELPARDNAAWARSWCHPTTCPEGDQAAVASFFERHPGADPEAVSACVSDRRSLFVLRGQIRETGLPGDEIGSILLACPTPERKLEFKARKHGQGWRVISIQWLDTNKATALKR